MSKSEKLAELATLEVEEQQIAYDRDRLSAAHKAVRADIDRLKAQIQIDEMPEADKAALLQLIKTAGIESGEQFGEIGA
jgi:hypothetical protein